MSLYWMWTTFLICLLHLQKGLAEQSCEDHGTTELHADGIQRLLSFPSDRSKDYPPDCQRQWRITTSGGWVEIQILSLDLEGTLFANTCNYDSLKIYSEHSYGKTMLATLCGTSGALNRTFSSRTFSVLVEFTSDHLIEGKGFVIAYVNGLERRDSGVPILSATYADKYLTYSTADSDYPDNADLSWRIVTASATQKLKIVIITVDIEWKDDNYCDFNSLTIHDGYNSEAPILARFCDELHTGHQSFTSSSQFLFLHFIAEIDDAVKGFKLLYSNAISEVTCNSDKNAILNLTASYDNKDLTSPQYPSAYPPNCQVQWRIRNPQKRVRFEVQALDVEAKNECAFDSLTFYDGYDDSAEILKKLCGYPSVDNRMFVSNSDYVFVRFISDGYRQGHGFQIYFKTEGETNATSKKWPRNMESLIRNIVTEERHHNTDVGAIVGITLGAVALVLTIAIAVAVTLKRSWNRKQRLHQQHHFRSLPTNLYTICPSTSLNYEPLTPEDNPLSDSENYLQGIIQDRQARPPTLSGENGNATFKEDDIIYQNGPNMGVNRENVEGNLSQEQNSGLDS